ncbi:MAG: recombinase family protein [Lachnospiraceae bacterium]|nr:recombinase family protein [Lachnospiraceae bacterium]
MPLMTDSSMADSAVSSHGRSSKAIRAAVYILLSEKISLEKELSCLAKLIDAASEFTLAGVYYDYDSSPVGMRVNYEHLLSDCCAEKIDRILCRSVSDFAPDASGFLSALRLLEDCRVTAWFERENLDTAISADVRVLTGLEVFQKEEKRCRSEARRQVIEKQRENRSDRSQAVYGYRYVDEKEKDAAAFPDAKGKGHGDILAVDEKEAAVVGRIFRLVADGTTLNDVAKLLNAEEIPAPRRKKRNSAPNAGGGALKEELSKGWTAQRIRQVVKLERYKTEEIVDGELFEAAQVALHTKKRSLAGGEDGSGKLARPLYSGKIVCGECGRFFHVTNRKVRPIWVCPNARLNNGMSLCRAGSVREETVTRVLRLALAEKFEVGHAADFRKGLVELLEEYQGFERRERADMESQIHEIQERKETLKGTLRIQRARLDVQKVRWEVLGEEDPEEEGVAALEAALERSVKEMEDLDAREESLLNQKNERAAYWEALAKSADGRRKLLERLRAMDEPERHRDETRTIGEAERLHDETRTTGDATKLHGETRISDEPEIRWEELDEEELSALIVSVTVRENHFSVRWFDYTRTDIHL